MNMSFETNTVKSSCRLDVTLPEGLSQEEILREIREMLIDFNYMIIDMEANQE